MIGSRYLAQMAVAEQQESALDTSMRTDGQCLSSRELQVWAPFQLLFGLLLMPLLLLWHFTASYSQLLSPWAMSCFPNCPSGFQWCFCFYPLDFCFSPLAPWSWFTAQAVPVSELRSAGGRSWTLQDFMLWQLRWSWWWLRNKTHPALSGKVEIGAMGRRKLFGRNGANTCYKPLSTTELAAWARVFFWRFQSDSTIMFNCLASKCGSQHQQLKFAGSSLFSSYLPQFPSFRDVWLLLSVDSHG